MIAQPLHNLIKKNAPFEWSHSQEHAFQRLKDCFASQSVLCSIDCDKPFTLQTDASDFAFGATLTQLQSDGLEYPITFLSGSLSPAKQNYDIYYKELLAVIKSLWHWRHYLKGAPHPIQILIDHTTSPIFMIHNTFPVT